jgi:hypothetical protein
VKKQGPEHAADWLADQIVVEFPGDSELMSVGMADDENHEASIIVNAVVDAVVTKAVEKERIDKLLRRDQLDKKLHAYKSYIMDKERLLFELNQQMGINDAETAKIRVERQIADLEHSIAEAAEHETAAELEVARGKHRSESLSPNSDESKAAKTAIDSAEFDMKFWNEKALAFRAEGEKLSGQLASTRKFTGDEAALRDEIDQLKRVARDLGETLIKMNIDMDAEPRVRILETPTH